MKKKYSTFVAIISYVFLMVWIPPCSGADIKEERATGTKNICLIMKTLTNPFFIEMEKGARLAEKELGIRLIVKTGAKETSIDQQISIVEDMILQHVDAIVIAPGSSTDLIPVLKKAQDSDIRIVNIDNRLDPQITAKIGLVNIPFISVDNIQGAYLATKTIIQKAPMPASAAILEGIRSATNANNRKQGALKAFKENPNIQIAAMESANWKIDEAFAVTSRIFAAHPEVNLLFCANDMMALGAIQFLQSTGKNNVLVAGFDALPEAIKAIRDGKLQVTVDQNAAQQGYLGIKYAFDLIRGINPPLETFIDVRIITRENLP